MSIGENSIDAIMNLRVARRMGERVVKTTDAATKLSPHTVATNRAASVPRFIVWVVNKYPLHSIHI